MANMLSMTAMLVVFGMAGKSHMAADLGIVQAAASALFLAFSANARTTVLATSSSAVAKAIFNLRVILLAPLILAAYWLSSTLGGVEVTFASILILRRTVEWLGEVDLSERERLGDKNFAISYVLTQAVLFGFATLWLLFGMSYPFLGLFFWAFLPLAFTLKFFSTALSDIANVFSGISRKIFPHFGSSLAIGISLYVFRLLLILILGKVVAGDLFAAFAIGGVLGSVFVNAFGPSIAFKEKANGRFKLPRLLRVLFWCMTGLGVLIVVSSLNMPGIFAWSGKEILYWQAIGYAMIGSVVTTHAHLLRNRLLIHNEHHDLFGPDLLMNMLVIVAIPLAYYTLGTQAVAALSLVGALLVFVFYKSSELAEILDHKNRSAINRYVQIGIAFAILMPVFVSLDSGIYLAKELSLTLGDSLRSIPIPISILFVYMGILIIGLYRSVHLTLSVIFSSFILMIFTTLLVSTGHGLLERNKIILVIQNILPMGALVLGEMFKDDGLDSGALVERVFFWVLVIVAPLQIVAGWLQGSLQLAGYVYIFSIYQYNQYVPVVLVAAYLFVMFSMWSNDSYQLRLIFLSFLMSIYAAASLSLIAIIFLLSGLLAFSITRSRLASERLPAQLFLAALFLCLGYFSIELSVMSTTQMFRDVAYETFSSWQLYSGEIFDSIKSLLLGHANVHDKSVFPSTHNFFLDIVRNFGLFSLLPFLVLFGYTARLVYLTRRIFPANFNLTGHLLVLTFMLVVDNSTQVSLRQPYSGVFTYFIWGLFIARVSKINIPK
jgi:hypothetical protein